MDLLGSKLISTQSYRHAIAINQDKDEPIAIFLEGVSRVSGR